MIPVSQSVCSGALLYRRTPSEHKQPERFAKPPK